MTKEKDGSGKAAIGMADVIATIDQYIAEFPEHIQAKLKEIRGIVRAMAPDAAEKIAYGMPTFYLNGNLVHFAGYKGHIGFYPTPTGIDSFKEELDRYKNAKGSVQFPLDEPLPADLIGRIVKYRVEENAAKARKPKKGKK
jgi:uncharacterized protein YdhG (YjbR/CyaY superfamily)